MTWLAEPYLCVDTTVSADTEWLDSGSGKAASRESRGLRLIVEPHTSGGSSTSTYIRARAGGVETILATVSPDGSSANPTGIQAVCPCVSGRVDYKIELGAGVSAVDLKMWVIGYE